MNKRTLLAQQNGRSVTELPIIISADGKQPLALLGQCEREQALKALSSIGGVLFRNFLVASPLEFKRFAASFGAELKSYEFGSTPRSKVFPGVYSSTEYPAHKHIPLHNEQSYTSQWPERIWFHCILPSETGGETPIADSRQVYRHISEATRSAFSEKGLLYVRNYISGLDLPWQDVFNTTEKAEVDRYCRDHKISFNWSSTGELQTRERCQASIQHPQTGEWVWFNQAHLFHISSLDEATRHKLINLVGVERLPRNVFFGDGSLIPDAMLDEVRAAYAACTLAFPWQAGDVLMLDNYLVAHGRHPYTGDRKVIVAMA